MIALFRFFLSCFVSLLFSVELQSAPFLFLLEIHSVIDSLRSCFLYLVVFSYILDCFFCCFAFLLSLPFFAVSCLSLSVTPFRSNSSYFLSFMSFDPFAFRHLSRSLFELRSVSLPQKLFSFCNSSAPVPATLLMNFSSTFFPVHAFAKLNCFPLSMSACCPLLSILCISCIFPSSLSLLCCFASWL